jgi:hypothetical protein
MAILLCKDHPPDNTKAKSPYTAFVHPVGYPKTAVICGRKNCQNAAILWLNRAEQNKHKRGIRVFPIGTYAIKIRVLKRLIFRLTELPQSNCGFRRLRTGIPIDCGQ